MRTENTALHLRFWKFVLVSRGCWYWQGATNEDGYGVFRLGAGTVLAHRLAYEFEHGELDDAACVLHTCDTPPCCNPSHLFTGDRDANNKDKKRKARTARGSKYRNSKLTDDAVRAIRTRYAAGGVSQAALASDYGVSQSLVCEVIRGGRWAHVV